MRARTEQFGSVDAAPVFAVRARTERFALSLVYTRSVVRTYTFVARHPARITLDNAPYHRRTTYGLLFAAGLF